jgi:cytochrome c peroxidase
MSVGRRSRSVAPVLLVGGCLLGSPGHGARERYAVAVPLGLDIAAPVPLDNPLSEAGVRLGRTLFFDPDLSADRSLSCASCHQPGRHFTDGRARAVGIGGHEGRRNVPSVLNVAYGRSFFWDGRAGSLEEQILEPIQSDAELGLGLIALVHRLSARESYPPAFRDAFGDAAITPDRVARAIAGYLRTLRSGNAPIDRFLYGDTRSLSPDARRGFRLFVGRANCGVCHTIPLFTDHQFHNTGISWGSEDTGRLAVTGQESDRGSFKTPSLRNVAGTAPYMHDGSIGTLEEVIEHYDRGGTPNPRLDEEIRPLRLSPDEKRQLIAFLRALTQSAPDP